MLLFTTIFVLVSSSPFMAKAFAFDVEIVKLYFEVIPDNWCRHFCRQSSEAVQIT
jgi:hypothetical protein